MIINLVIFLSVLSLLIIHASNIFYDITTHERFARKGNKPVKEVQVRLSNQRLRYSTLKSEISDTPSMFLDETSYSSICEEVKEYIQQERQISNTASVINSKEISQDSSKKSCMDKIFSKQCCSLDHSYTTPAQDENSMQEITNSDFLLQQKNNLVEEFKS